MAHAVMELNSEDGGSRRFIQVQLPEPTPSGSEARAAGYATIADLSRRRIELAADAIDQDSRGHDLDTGFRVFRLSDTNFSKWKATSELDVSRLEQHLFSLRESADDDASPEAILTELILKQGYSLSEQVSDTVVEGLRLKSVGNGLVLAYLEEDTKPTLQQLRSVLENEDLAKFIILEDAFHGDDELKTNLVQEAKSRNIELWTA